MADIIHKIFGQKHGHHSSKHSDEKAKAPEAEGYTKQQADFCK